MISDETITSARALRHELHASPDLSGHERATAARLKAWLADCGPREIIEDLGGHGLAAVFTAPDRTAGPTVVLRAELDALPIAETSGVPHASRHAGRAHACGHDGHLALLGGVARHVARRPLRRGRLVLLCQPAEETGQGARAVVEDPRWAALAADHVFALHNLPGHETGRILLRPGPFTAASVGLVIRLQGRTAHAAYPEQGLSPGLALGRLVSGLVSLPIALQTEGRLALVTVVHARLGEVAFGTSPGTATIMATLRAADDDILQELRRRAVTLAAREAARDGLEGETSWVEEFPATVNHDRSVAIARRAARRARLAIARPPESPFRWSEDFGWFLRATPGALIGLGAGRDHPVLHASDYDFPDALLPLGLRFYAALLTELGLL